MHNCIVCPKEDNLPKGYRQDPDSWAIFYSFVHDGNFSAQHTLSRQPGNNIPLFPGTGAFQDPEEVKEAMKIIKSDVSGITPFSPLELQLKCSRGPHCSTTLTPLQLKLLTTFTS